jgi:GntR family negative regulator for fad regulon and positive regulator of fabA
MASDPPLRPAELAESRLIEGILLGKFPMGSALPPERILAHHLGITRPTLREALQRLARDGWIDIRHGRPTRVRDIWQEGKLGVLGAIARQRDPLPPDFVALLLTVRQALAPTYTGLAVEHSPQALAAFLQTYPDLPDEAEAMAEADCDLHRILTMASGNPIFTMILNSFGDIYRSLARSYFASPRARQHSRHFYSRLLAAARAGNARAAENLARRVMAQSLQLWRRTAARAERLSRGETGGARRPTATPRPHRARPRRKA